MKWETLLLPIAQYIVRWVLENTSIDDELEDGVVAIMFLILEKAVKATKTEVDDQLVAALKSAMNPGEPLMVEVEYAMEENK